MSIRVLNKPITLDVVYIKPKNITELPVVAVVGKYRGKEVWGYGQVNATLNNTSKALGQWVEKAYPERLATLAGRVATIKYSTSRFDYTLFDDVLYGLSLNTKNNKVFIESRVGMSAIREICKAIGIKVDVEMDGVNFLVPVVKKIVLEDVL